MATYKSIYIAPPPPSLPNLEAKPLPPSGNIPILRGITTYLAVFGVDDTGGTHPITSEVAWTLNGESIDSSKTSANGITLSTAANGQVQATSTTIEQTVTLGAAYAGLKTDVKLTDQASDLLIYAPDGKIYRIHKDVWASQQVVPVTSLAEAVETELAGEVRATNITTPSTSENITCFLLNLNSILLNNP